MVRDRRLTVHLVIPNLNVPGPWRVGRVILRPHGWLSLQIKKSPAGTDGQRTFHQMALDQLGALGPSATASVEVLHPRDSKNNGLAVFKAREAIRDAIGVMRLYQRSRVPLSNRSIQAFGLPADVMSVIESNWIFDSAGRLVGSGGGWKGTIGAWTFTPADVHAYHRDPRFSMLDAAIRDPATDWGRRIATALRTLAIANASTRPSVRITQCATALEVLLADQFVSGVRFDNNGRMVNARAGSQEHLVCRRGAYLTCIDMDGVAHHPRNPACLYLQHVGYRKMREAQFAYQLAKDLPGVCSAYEDLNLIFEDRAIVLHGANDHYDERDASRHEITVDRTILAAIEWVLRTGSTTLGDLEQEIRKLPNDPALQVTSLTAT